MQPQGDSIWGNINLCIEIALNIYYLCGEKGEGIVIPKEQAEKDFSPETVAAGKESDGICTVLFVYIEQQPGRRRGRKHFYDSNRKKFSRKSYFCSYLTQPLRNAVQKPRCAQYANCHHQSDQCRHDFDHRPEAILCPFHKFLIHRLSV